MATTKRYVAFISQTGASPPVLQEKENDLGGPLVPSYAGQGGYYLTLAGAFPDGKVLAKICGQPNAFTDYAYARRDTDDRLVVLTANAHPSNGTAAIPADSVLSPFTWIEVVVYE